MEDRNSYLTAHVGRSAGLLVGASLLALAVAAPACAQSEPADESYLPEVVVTAQKRSESSQRVAISIQSLDAAKLEQLAASKLQDVEMATPSLSFGDGSEQGRTGIRGIIDYSRNSGYDSRVGVYIDGVYYSRSWMNNQTLLGIAQVDVLRGPQGTLFGKNTDAGVISITTIQPSDIVNGEVEGEVGNFGQRKIAGRANMPLTDKIYAQLAATHLENDGYYKNVLLGQRNQGVNSNAVRGQLRYDGEFIDVTLSGDFTRDRNSTLHYTYIPPAGSNVYEFNSFNDDHADRDQGGLSATVEAKLPGDYTLTSITAWRSGSQLLNFSNETGPTPFLTAIFKQTTDQFSQELRVASPREEHYDFVAGVYYFYAKNKDDYRSAWGSGVRVLGPLYAAYVGKETQVVTSVSTKSIAGFAQGTVRPNDMIEVFAGGRLTSEKKTLNDITTMDPIGLFRPPLTGLRDQASEVFFTPKGGVNLFLRPNMMVFGAVARGFKSGGWNVEATTPAALAAGIDFKPETVTSYELGLKSDLFDRRARVNVTGFYQKFKDFQVFTFVPVQLLGRTVLSSSLANVGVVSSKGVELDVTLALTRELTISGNYTYNESQYDRYPGGAGTLNGVILDADGVQTPYAPKNKAYVAVDYVRPLAGDLELAVHVGYSTQSSQNFDPKVANPAQGSAYFIKGYDLMDARLNLSSEVAGWSASIWCKNLLDKDYIRFANRTAVLGNPVILYGQPRSYGLTLGYKF